MTTCRWATLVGSLASLDQSLVNVLSWVSRLWLPRALKTVSIWLLQFCVVVAAELSLMAELSRPFSDSSTCRSIADRSTPVPM